MVLRLALSVDFFSPEEIDFSAGLLLDFFIFAMVTDNMFGFGGAGWLGIAISLFAVGLASVTLALDFDAVDTAIRTGAPQKYSWLLAHGIIVSLVWLYIEFLRLFARLREN
mgnify:CR=1 FL=1